MYQNIIIDAINFIKEHLEEDLTVEDIAKHCHFSKYYFNRIFKQEVGESVYAFIKRLKLEGSAMKIITDSDKSITEVSAQYGYSSSNYSAAFRKHYSSSPREYKQYFTESVIKKRQGHYTNLTGKNFDHFDKQMKKTSIEDIKVIYRRFIGDYRNLHNYWERFFDKYGECYGESSIRIEISYDDPVVTSPDRCITDLCITTNKPMNSLYNTKIIKGGSYLIYHFDGPNKEIFGTFQGLMGIWIPRSKLYFDLDDRKIFSIMELTDKDNDHYIFDIYIPYKKSTNSEV
ncbi:AraC family transcriptional regulator [Tepidibacter hydrothermalis]|uniref:AraC family transcriptional regulator n=1 Tax=Tepidibacter hydrothermalis TaxID=3036126 RepID=A0ABY8EBB1_9FIRM|nr:AraC family transcriptional regulator [Tepidibacter hydrothermalis]WFD10223.1 AraC family transcriptional regulator [Tepidibacter hydrothermalis]